MKSQKAKGRRPKPFMLAGKAPPAKAVWHSNRAVEAGKTKSIVQNTAKVVHSAQKMPNAVLGIVISNPRQAALAFNRCLRNIFKD